MAGPAYRRETEVPSEPIHRLTVQQYRAMGRTGILTSEDRVELLEGWLVEKMTKNPPHRIATRRARVALERVVPAGWYVDTHEPITTADSEPEPDVAVIRGRTEDYPDRNPGADHVALIVEVADATLVRDRHVKALSLGNRAGHLCAIASRLRV
jgi:Uma2 family endonuclease